MAKEYLIIDKEILPEYYEKVVKTKQDLLEKRFESVQEACKKNGISRSTYYKYKDHIFKTEERSEGNICVFSMSLSHEPGVLSKVCRKLSDLHISILTISQSLPIQGKADILISADISNLSMNVNTMIEELRKIDQVLDIHLLSFEK